MGRIPSGSSANTLFPAQLIHGRLGSGADGNISFGEFGAPRFF